MLPQASLTKADGSQQTVDVVWESVAASKYERPGTFTVAGVAQDDSRMPVEATVTVESPVNVEVSAETRCVAGKVTLAVKVTAGGADAASVTVTTAYGSRVATVAAGKSASYAFSTRSASVPVGEVSVDVTQGEATGVVTATYAARSCG